LETSEKGKSKESRREKSASVGLGNSRSYLNTGYEILGKIGGRKKRKGGSAGISGGGKEGGLGLQRRR